MLPPKFLKQRRLRFLSLLLFVISFYIHCQHAYELLLQFFPSDKAENEKFTNIAQNRASKKYFPSFKVAEMVGLSGRAVAKITSSFMVITSNGQKNNLGLSLKFDAKALKVIDYSRKEGRFWEFSEKAVELIRDYKVLFPIVPLLVYSLPGSNSSNFRKYFVDSMVAVTVSCLRSFYMTFF